jgi:hypothetical protein
MDPVTEWKGSMMRIRTMAGIAVAGTAAAAGIFGGIAYATADEAEPTVRIITEQEAQPAQQPERDCPDEGGSAAESPSPSPEGAGL